MWHLDKEYSAEDGDLGTICREGHGLDRHVAAEA